MTGDDVKLSYIIFTFTKGSQNITNNNQRKTKRASLFKHVDMNISFMLACIHVAEDHCQNPGYFIVKTIQLVQSSICVFHCATNLWHLRLLLKTA